MDSLLIAVNIAILFFQAYLRAEIKRLDEKIEILFKRLDRLENRTYNRIK